MPLDPDSDNDYEYRGLSHIKCPHCDKEDRDSWETREDGEIECGYCGKEFWVSVNVEVTYSTEYIKCKKS
jgi:transcription elongation factor Elf1